MKDDEVVTRMAIIETKLDNISDCLKDNKEEHKAMMLLITELSETKANKSDVTDLKNRFITGLISIISILLGISGYLINKFVI